MNAANKHGFLFGLLCPGDWRAKKEATMYSYNGVVLPKLPEWDTETYPYAHLWVHNVLGYATLHYSTSPVYAYVGANGNGLKYAEAGSLLSHDLRYAGGQWDAPVQSENEAGDTCGFDSEANVWTNTDIFYEDGTLYIAASKPVPVYE